MIIELNCRSIGWGLVASVPLFGGTNQAAVTLQENTEKEEIGL